MATKVYCRILATTVMVFVFSLGNSVWPQGFPRSSS